ncbi:hypothetical protein FRC11_010991, partial [Ceratobasidium sp. 423]
MLNGFSQGLYGQHLTTASQYYADGLGPGTHVLKAINIENKVLSIDYARVEGVGKTSFTVEITHQSD